MNSLLAIDPGAAGGLAWIDPQGKVVADPMPRTPGDVLDYIRSITLNIDGPPAITAYVEQVSGYAGGDGQPGSAMFRFGQGVGFLHGVLMALGVRMVLVTPQRWQAALGLGTRGARSKSEWKRHLKSAAERLYPSIRVSLSNADALLILEHARRQERTYQP